MATKTKAKQSSRVTWVWGDSKKGIAAVRSARKSGGKYWWDIHHVKNGKVVLVHRDYPTKTEAVCEKAPGVDIPHDERWQVLPRGRKAS